LHFGEISPGQIWNRILKKFKLEAGQILPPGIEVYAKEIVWREFGYHLLFHFPHTTTQPLRSDYSRFPWVKDKKSLVAWQKGRTGYPMVDAGMRQLWATGWMHNRVRMIVASFLVKHLLLPWQRGAEWFWDTLVDADLASNTLGWQWSAGCGADAAPYFRIFNPVTQGEKFDPKGDYVRRWVPELAGLGSTWIHKPWAAPPFALREAGITLGVDYPHPIVDHAKARNRALDALASLKG
jgi:deoxyribodipyrimidine photo-lyase